MIISFSFPLLFSLNLNSNCDEHVMTEKMKTVLTGCNLSNYFNRYVLSLFLFLGLFFSLQRRRKTILNLVLSKIIA